MPLIAAILVVAAALGGGVSIAANSALPGDLLWGFKTTVNENVEGALAMGDEAKAGWDISVAADRLDEAQKLAADGKLDANAQADITANFDAHAQDVATLVAKLQAHGQASEASDVAARFQSTIVEHASAVAQTSAGQSADAQASVAPFLTDVRGTLDAAANLSAAAAADASGQGNSAPSGSASTSASGTVEVNIY